MGNPSKRKVESARFRTLSTQVWRRGWDSNPCGIAPKLISSQPRYDHFDTSPCLSQHLTPENRSGFWGELMGRTYLIFSFRTLRKPSKIKGSGERKVHKGHTISSQARYDHFDTPPCVFFVRFSSFLRWDQKTPRKELTERTTEYSIFEPVKNRTVTAFVRYETHSLNGDFESAPL